MWNSSRLHRCTFEKGEVDAGATWRLYPRSGKLVETLIQDEIFTLTLTRSGIHPHSRGVERRILENFPHQRWLAKASLGNFRWKLLITIGRSWNCVSCWRWRQIRRESQGDHRDECSWNPRDSHSQQEHGKVECLRLHLDLFRGGR